MAINEHLQILNKGKEEWNAWRKSNPDITPDLSEIDLSNIDFGNNDLPQNLSSILKSKNANSDGVRLD